MKHGCMIMTLRLSSGCRSGSRQIHRGWKKHMKFTAMSSQCWSFLSTSKALNTRNLYPWSNRQWQVLLWGFEAAEGGHSAQTSRQVEEKQLVSPPWQRACSHIPCVWQFLTSKNFAVIPPPICLTSPPVTFSYSPRWNYGWKGIVWHDWWDPRRNARSYWHTFENFQECRKSWETRWDLCIGAQGGYFEGDGRN